MTFRFLLNRRYVLLHAVRFRGSAEPFPGWTAFIDQIYEDHPRLYWELRGAPERTLFPASRSPVRGFKRLFTAPPVKRLFRETNAYRLAVESQWRKNERAVLSFLETCGLRLPANTIRVFITHPLLWNGRTVDDRTIVWGHPEDFPNYSTVHLCHELLHVLTRRDSDPVTHAVIELLADNALRLRLGGGSRFFEFQGHEELRPLERRLLSSFRRFLASSDRDLSQFIVKAKLQIRRRRRSAKIRIRAGRSALQR
jgi:hypothetical protein